MMTDEQVNEAIKQMVQQCQIVDEGFKAGTVEYQFLSAREVLYLLGYPQEHADQVLKAIADKGFTHCLDRTIPFTDPDTKEVSYPPQDACSWGHDQLLSRLRFIERG